jgi:hypothetical protein
MGIEDNNMRVGDKIVKGVVILGSSGSIVDFGTTGNVKDGSKNVTTAGTRVALASTTACQGVLIQAKAANTGIIYIGGSTVSSTSGIFLYAGESVTTFAFSKAGSQSWFKNSITFSGVLAMLSSKP